MLNSDRHLTFVDWTSIAGMEVATSDYLEICKSNNSRAIIETANLTSSSAEVYNDVFNFALASAWHIVSKLPFLFYLVWPTETMFSSLDQVPRYVTEVSVLPPPLPPWPSWLDVSKRKVTI